ncbi:hypothetical protein INT45_013232 [Circinella minor]|uniref:DUF6729 domain-containing protein n=1 Tax=Circinella minor TaxID=1195481 RepID=A0A8H7RUV5_9FUNG|nr:hypothetical protein INT45_013232 [Circinella minor]
MPQGSSIVVADSNENNNNNDNSNNNANNNNSDNDNNHKREQTFMDEYFDMLSKQLRIGRNGCFKYWFFLIATKIILFGSIPNHLIILNMFLRKKSTIPKPSPLKLYKPRVFIWILHLLVPNRKIDCPTCPMTLKSKHLQAQGWATTLIARCICDLTNNFYVISYRYKCPQCFNEKGKPGKKFAGHDQDLMKKSLPESLVLGFPAILTHRSAISNDMMDMMRSCFSNGMGSTPFTNMLTMLHTKRHNVIEFIFILVREELQKLQEKNKTHSITKYISTTYNKTNSKKHSQHLIIKTSMQALSQVLNTYISECFEEFVKIHRKEYDKHTATQPATVLTVDHCYKTCKHIFKLENTKIFKGLLTMTNEFNEIRVQQFVPTSSMDYIKRSVKEISNSLTLCSHPQPKLLFTDKANQDKILDLPVDWSYALHNTNNSKNEALEAINVIAEDKEITVGFYSEWTYNRTTPAWYPTETVQIAYNDINSNVNQVIIVQLSKFKSLPQMLISFLSNANIKKLILEIFGKERDLISRINTSLAEICAVVLGCQSKKGTETPEKAIGEFEGKPISDNHAIVEVTSVLVPGAKLQLCNGTPLSSYVNSREQSGGSSILLIDDPRNQIEIADQTITGEEEECNNDLVDEDDINNDLGYMEVQSVEQHASFMEDQDLKAYGISLLKLRYEKIKKQLSSKNENIPTTRIIVQDVWYALKLISTPKRHSLQVEFERKLTDAVMLLD